MEPFFVLMKLPGETAGALLHHAALHAAQPRQHDRLGGGELRSRRRTASARSTCSRRSAWCSGPEQVSAQINQDAAISPQLSLWNQRGSQAIFGNMLVIPIKDSIVYVQPLYLQAESTAHPGAHARARRLRRQGRDGEARSRRRCSRCSARPRPRRDDRHRRRPVEATADAADRAQALLGGDRGAAQGRLGDVRREDRAARARCSRSSSRWRRPPRSSGARRIEHVGSE